MGRLRVVADDIPTLKFAIDDIKAVLAEIELLDATNSSPEYIQEVKEWWEEVSAKLLTELEKKMGGPKELGYAIDMLNDMSQ